MPQKNILYVDDRVGWVATAKMTFERRLKAKVTTANDADSGIDAMARQHFDLVVVDGLNGDCFRLIDQAKQLAQGFAVIFSGDLDIGDRANEYNIRIIASRVILKN